jgi:phage repressor protein C with HTH and peptisase S24 domain
MRIDRLREEMASRGLSQSELARTIGSTQGAVQQILSGQTKRTKRLPEIAAALGVSVQYLLGETDEKAGGAVYVPRTTEEMAFDLGVTRVREVPIEYGMGGGSFIEDYVEERWRSFDTEWLRDITSSPADKLFVARGIGDSMMPTLMDNDTLLVDRGQVRIQQQDRIWALTYGEVGMIKRVRRLPGQRLLIMSDNNHVSDFEAADEEVHMLGRVVWIGRKA